MSAPSAPPETPTPVEADPEPTTEETEAPSTEVEESAAPDAAEDAAALVPQVAVEEQATKPDYITREEWERERAEVAKRAADEALDLERRKRQAENARRLNAEREEREAAQEAVDTLKAALGARGIFELPDETAMAAINRITQKRAERMQQGALESLDAAMDFIVAPAYGKEKVDLPDHAVNAAMRLSPRIQELVNIIRPQIEEAAKKAAIDEFVKNELPKRLEADRAARNARGREGQTNIPRTEGAPAATKDMSPQAVINRIISGDADEKDKEAYPDARRAMLVQGRQ